MNTGAYAELFADIFRDRHLAPLTDFHIIQYVSKYVLCAIAAVENVLELTSSTLGLARCGFTKAQASRASFETWPAAGPGEIEKPGQPFRAARL